MPLLPPGMMSVEAVQFDGTNGDQIGQWIASRGKPCKTYVQGDGDPQPSYVEFPLKDAKPDSPLWHCRASVGQWILFGPKGFERWSAEQFERVFHRITVLADKDVGHDVKGMLGRDVRAVPRSVGGEGAAERLAREQRGDDDRG